MPVPGRLDETALRALYRPLVARKRPVRERARAWLHRAARPVRRSYYEEGRRRRVIASLPRQWRVRLGLDDPTAVGSRRIEIGSGDRPSPGHIHVDMDAEAWHTEVRAPAWRLPFSDEWAEEILAIHSLEHVPPLLILPTLREWRRVLRPGATLRVHVPNCGPLMERFLSAAVDEKWALAGGLLGMCCSPTDRTPERFRQLSQHQILFDAPLLRWVLAEAGFGDLVDLTEEVADFHTEAWKDLVPRYSLVVEARKPGPSPQSR
jgi:hypothetical protein